MEENSNKPAYFAILPANVRYDKELKLLSRLLYAEITSLCNKEGYCWASNKYFANLYQVSIQTISNCISQLKEKGYIQLEMIYKEGTKEILYRYIRIFEYPIKENFNTPIKENFKDNNTSINNKVNNKNIIKEDNKFDEFWQLYPNKKEKKKAKEKFIKILKTTEFDVIMNGLKNYLEYIQFKKLEDKYIKHPTTWLNGECWNDEYNIRKSDGTLTANSINFEWSV